jgi:NAD(P)-dependent dehydrogenase (short-subunit alcohol dehydrogenase family)
VARERGEDVSRDRSGDGRRGKTAIVTGGASGIGRALAIRLAADGMKVGVADVHRDRLNELTGVLPQSMGLEVDVSAPEAMEVAARRFMESLGPPHVLCLNAGIGGPAGRRLWELAPSEWERTMGVNLFGVVNGLRSFLPAMIAAGEGQVVITASMSAITSGPSIPVYCASKRAVLSVADSLRRQVARDGLPISVSVLLPATVSTNFGEGRYGESGPGDGVPGASAPVDPSVVADQVVAAIDQGRFYIFTHPDSQNRVEAWYSEVIEAYHVFDQ